MSKGINWDAWIGVGMIFAMFIALGLVVMLNPAPAKAPAVTIYCEGEYRIFMRGEQIEVLYDPDCLKLVKT